MGTKHLKGDIVKCVEYVNERFVYTRDYKLLDQWSVMKLIDGKFYGDCEDYSLTVFWYYCGCSVTEFLKNYYITRKTMIKFVKGGGRDGEGHAIGSADGYLFDNWSKKAMSEDEFWKLTKHHYKFDMKYPIIQMIVGFIKRCFK